MQSLRKRRLLQHPTTWGAGAFAVATVVALVLAYSYVSPPWERIVTFYTDDSATMRPGDEVRIAGVRVGAVKDLSLEANQVRVRLRVDKTAHVGDQSNVDVRMLTVVGGYYVNIDSIGRAELGSNSAIPRERVTMPYSLIRALSDTTDVVQQVNPKPINESLNDIQAGLQGSNIQSLSAIVDAGNSIMSTIERQRGQITSILNVSNQYIDALTDYRDQLVPLVRKISIIVATLELYERGFAKAIDGLGDTVLSLKPVSDFYENHRQEFIEKVRQHQHRVREFVERNGVTIRVLHRLQNLFDRILNAQNARPALLATDLCIPTPGTPC
ncbi:MlaD family protein [Mycobacterium vicinigordonae]|uniref:MCE family protein n=1 Tax=Mycobacterium vicinigordonae TaxID=1719132 RepID=A0A7D6EAI2_9MYCO|nr:MlaD family protein [Mycobacterium vicinigordonae]QLL08705.1 MCE family protein [Mycobacterium vicinigordonae]